MIPLVSGLMRWVVPDGVFWTRADRMAVDVEFIRVCRDGVRLYLAEMQQHIEAYRARWPR